MGSALLLRSRQLGFWHQLRMELGGGIVRVCCHNCLILPYARRQWPELTTRQDRFRANFDCHV